MSNAFQTKSYIQGLTGFTGETDGPTVAALISTVIDEGMSGGPKNNPVGTMMATLDSTPAMLFVITANDGTNVTVKAITVT